MMHPSPHRPDLPGSLIAKLGRKSEPEMSVLATELYEIVKSHVSGMISYDADDPRRSRIAISYWAIAFAAAKAWKIAFLTLVSLLVFPPVARARSHCFAGPSRRRAIGPEPARRPAKARRRDYFPDCCAVSSRPLRVQIIAPPHSSAALRPTRGSRGASYAGLWSAHAAGMVPRYIEGDDQWQQSAL
jgi:hypothetical protein